MRSVGLGDGWIDNVNIHVWNAQKVFKNLFTHGWENFQVSK